MTSRYGGGGNLAFNISYKLYIYDIIHEVQIMISRVLPTLSMHMRCIYICTL